MAKASTLVEGFATALDPAVWNVAAGSTVSGGFLTQVPTTAYTSVETWSGYDLTESEVVVELSQPPTGNSFTEATLQIRDATAPASKWLLWQWKAGTIRPWRTSDGNWQAVANELTYDIAVHRWLRIRVRGALVQWDTSGDGMSWTTRGTWAWDWQPTTVRVLLYAGIFGATTPPPANVKWANLNRPPQPTSPPRGWAIGAGWRYLAQRVNGNVPGLFVDTELPLQEVTITDALSGPPSLTASISPTQVRMIGADGLPLLPEWGTIIHAENDGSVRGSFILVGSKFEGEKWTLDCMGFTGYLKGMAYTGAGLGTGGFKEFIQADPLDIVRHIWADVQAQQGSDLFMQVDSTSKTDIKVGTDPSLAASGTGEQPFRLTWWETHDLGGVIDQLAGSTPFDYRERHVWNTTRTEVNHYLDFGYPSLGNRRIDLRFVLGENVQVMPAVARDGEDFANHVRLLGAGEGSEMTMAESRRDDGRLRRMAVVDDKAITDKAVASTAARMELARRSQLTQVSDLAVRNMPSAPFGSFGVGDEIRVQGQLDWMPIDLWCRVTALTITPDNPDLMKMSIVRTDWMTL